MKSDGAEQVTHSLVPSIILYQTKFHVRVAPAFTMANSQGANGIIAVLFKSREYLFDRAPDVLLVWMECQQKQSRYLTQAME